MKARVLCVGYGLVMAAVAWLLVGVSPLLLLVWVPLGIWFGNGFGKHVSRLAFTPRPASHPHHTRPHHWSHA